MKKTMAMISYPDEKTLQRKICIILNKSGYHFKKEKDAYFCDIVDTFRKVYCEVKTQGKFAPQQLLYGLARNNIDDAQYLALANEYEIRFYKPPPFETIMKFARRISADLSRSPSSIVSKKHMNEAFNILGDHLQIYNYVGTFRIEAHQPYIFLDNSNYEYFQMILTKYRINPAEFINTFATTWSERSQLRIKNDNQTIMDVESERKVKAHRNILNKFDRALIEATRIRPNDIEKIIHRIDELVPTDVRRHRGKYWSSTNVSEIATALIREYVNPTFIFEPFVGGGSLIRDLVDECDGVVNDIDKSAVDLLEQEWEGYNWQYHRNNLMTTPLYELYDWLPDFGDDDVFCIYTNPPFGSTHGVKITSTKQEIINMAKKSSKSRKTKIQYGADKKEAKYIGDTYGRGDLCLPAIAKQIEIIKKKGTGYLAFFSPFGIMLGRKRYVKLFKSLLKDFEFLHGSVYSGAMFNGVNKKKSISFTIWKYHKNNYTDANSLTFWYGDQEYQTRQLPLLKHGWSYHNMKYVRGEICVQHNDTFNSPPPKIMHIQIKKGGSEMVPENVKLPLNIPNVPDELGYGLWSTVVGVRSLSNHPVIFDNCYTHLPDFSNEKTMEILTYAVLNTMIVESLNDYTQGKIGFVGMRRVFQFGGPTLTEGATYLLNIYSDCPIGEGDIGSIYDQLQRGDEIPKDTRILIKREIAQRLEAIGYWDYLPIPRL